MEQRRQQQTESNTDILNQIKEELNRVQILIRTNNLLLARFILQLSETRKELGLPKRNIFFKFELLEDDYNELAKEFGKEETDKALYRLDRMLIKNKQQCPNNIRKYIASKLRKSLSNKEERKKKSNSSE
jgi:hypothetical protein|nr:MAG TPA: hypothetical protein [Caudoviricetes sp.]